LENIEIDNKINDEEDSDSTQHHISIEEQSDTERKKKL
jgi:hypothetical protein